MASRGLLSIARECHEAITSLGIAPAWAVPRYVVPRPWMRPPALPRALPSRSLSGCIDTARRGCRASWKKAPRGRVLLLHFLLSLCESLWVRKCSDHLGWGHEKATIHKPFQNHANWFHETTSHSSPCAAEV